MKTNIMITVDTKFNDITIVEHGLILENLKEIKREIPFSELDKIYIKTYKLNILNKLVFILFPFFLIYLSLEFIALEKLLFVGLTAAIPVFVKVNNYKKYRLFVCLKDGTAYRKRVTMTAKAESISIVNAVRKKQLNHFTKTNA